MSIRKKAVVRKKAATRKTTVKKKTATTKKSAASRTAKEVIHHDPFALAEEAELQNLSDVGNKNESPVLPSVDTTSTSLQQEPNMSEQEQRVDESADNGAAVDLGHNLTIADTESHWIQFSNMISDALPVMLNATDVEQVDGAGLQLLAAFFKQAEEKGVDVGWSGVSGVLLEAVRMIGLTEVLKMQDVGNADGEGTAWGLF